jgi:hypothetical protein
MWLSLRIKQAGHRLLISINTHCGCNVQGGLTWLDLGDQASAIALIAWGM